MFHEDPLVIVAGLRQGLQSQYRGDRCVIDLDEKGNITKSALSDGNPLTFVDDEFARLVSDADPLRPSWQVMLA